MRACGRGCNDGPSEDVGHCEVFSTQGVGNVSFVGNSVQDQMHLLAVVPYRPYPL